MTAIALALGALAAYPLARLHLPGKRLLLTLLIFTQMIPAIVMAIPVLLMFRAVGLKDTVLGLVIVNVAFWLPLVIWLLRNVLKEVPRSLEYAARIDGCSRIGSLFRVLVPAAAPGIAAVAILLLIGTWNEFLFAVILGDRDAVTVTRLIGFLDSTVGPDGPPPFTLARGRRHRRDRAVSRARHVLPPPACRRSHPGICEGIGGRSRSFSNHCHRPISRNEKPGQQRPETPAQEEDRHMGDRERIAAQYLQRQLSRRQVLKAGAFGSSAALLAACTPTTQTTAPTTAPTAAATAGASAPAPSASATAEDWSGVTLQVWSGGTVAPPAEAAAIAWEAATGGKAVITVVPFAERALKFAGLVSAQDGTRRPAVIAAVSSPASSVTGCTRTSRR